MRRFLIKRLILGIFIVVFGTFITYAVLRCLPTSYVEQLAREAATRPVSASSTLPEGMTRYEYYLGQLNKKYGMDKNIIEGFLTWAGSAIIGDFGESWLFTQPVTYKFGQVIWYSVFLQVLVLIVEMLIAVPLGILAAKKQYSKTDYAISIFAIAGMSLPTFFLALLLKYTLSIKLGWFPYYGIASSTVLQMTPFQRLLDIGWHLVLPIITLAMLSIGPLMRYTRTNMLEVLNADYIRTARAKGLPEKAVINRHAFRNTMIPLISYMSYLIPALFTGALITETLYSIPGIGLAAYEATIRGDIPFTMFYVAFQLVLTQVSLMVADIMYAVADPRVRIN